MTPDPLPRYLMLIVNTYLALYVTVVLSPSKVCRSRRTGLGFPFRFRRAPDRGDGRTLHCSVFHAASTLASGNARRGTHMHSMQCPCDKMILRAFGESGCFHGVTRVISRGKLTGCADCVQHQGSVNSVCGHLGEKNTEIGKRGGRKREVWSWRRRMPIKQKRPVSALAYLMASLCTLSRCTEDPAPQLQHIRFRLQRKKEHWNRVVD